MSSRLLAALLVVLAACQSEAGAVQMVCDIPKDCPVCINAWAAGDMDLYQRHFRANLRNPKIKELLEVMETKPGLGVPALRRAAAEHGIAECVFADHLARPIVILAKEKAEPPQSSEATDVRPDRPPIRP